MSSILVRINSYSFKAKIDERGRFVIPSDVRSKIKSNSGYVFRNGRDSVKVNMTACGAVVPSASLGRDPKIKVIL